MTRWRRRLAWAAALVFLTGGALAVSGWWWLRVPAVDCDPAAARARFAAVLNGGSRRDDAIACLAGATDRAPDDAALRLWFGLANMHAFIDRGELPYAIRAAMAFDRAVELDPTDTSAAGWRAFFEYQAAEHRGQDLEAPREALLDAAAADPRFTPFLAAITLAPLPLESGYPERVLAPLERIEDCGDGTSHSCRTSPLFPHGAEGYHATVGDLRVRLGDLEGGRASYARALEVPSVDTWPYRAEFEAWTRGAEARMRLLTNDDPADDPPVFFATGERACAICHHL